MSGSLYPNGRKIYPNFIHAVFSMSLAHSLTKYLALYFTIGFIGIYAEGQVGSGALQVRTLAWNREGTHLALGGSFSSLTGIQILDENNQVVRFISTPYSPFQVTWSVDDTQIAALYAISPNYPEYSIGIYNSITGDEVTAFTESGPKSDRLIHWHPNNQLIATETQGIVNIYNISTGEVQSLPNTGISPNVFALSWSLDGSTIYTGSYDHIIRSLDWENQTILGQVAVEGAITMTMSSDGTKLAVSGNEGNITVLDTNTLDISTLINSTDHLITQPVYIIWSRDNSNLAIVGFDRIAIWSISNNQITDTIEFQSDIDYFKLFTVDFNIHGEFSYIDDENDVSTVPLLTQRCSTTIPAADISALLAAITSANASPEPDTICLEAGKYTLDAPITSEITLVDLGAGAEIIGTLQVSGAGRLTLRNVTVTP